MREKLQGGKEGVARAQKTSLGLVAVGAAAVLIFSGVIMDRPAKTAPVFRARAMDPLRKVLVLNGNRNADYVIFDHESHKQRLESGSECRYCHHLSRPGDLHAPCRLCHSDMISAVSIFSHSFHQDRLGGKNSCSQCHDLARVKSLENSKPCHECHAENMKMLPPPPGERFNPWAPPYPAAMHGVCRNCHEKQAEETNRSELSHCDACHQQVHHAPDER